MRSIPEMIAAIKDLQKRVDDLEMEREPELAKIAHPMEHTITLRRGRPRKNAHIEGSDG